MPHAPYGEQSVYLEAFLGLVTNAAPESLPEGASPLNWDVDYHVGDVFTRAGLVSSYLFVKDLGLLQEDGISFFLLEDGSGTILLEN